MPKTILLADDSVTIQKVVGISFANEDVVLLTVDNGDDAVLRAREARPDLVLADIAMPGKDGYAVCEAVKNDPELAHVPVLLLSGTFETFDDERARQVRADGHITKPFEAQALVDRVNDLLARAEAERPVSGAATTVLVSEQQPSASDAFEFFDDELAGAPQDAAASPATTVLLAAADEVDEIPLEPVAGDPLDIPSADDLDAPEALPVAHFEDEPQPGDGHATMLFDAVPPPIPGEAPRAPLDVEFAETRSSRTPLVAEPESGFGSTRLLDAEPAADPLDFGFESEEVPAVATALRDTATIEPRRDEDDDSEAELFEAEPEPLIAPPPVPAAASQAAPSSSGSNAHLEVLRTELREHLEKVAWEAFGDLSERIVRETVARVEAVAWEVIPQMAETLIREEIRKLQSDE
jgi:CheY-like chemotaxis protein